MSQHRRFAESRADKAQMTSQGFLMADAHFTRTGVFKYRKADGTLVRELRHPDDVFNDDSMASLKMAPVTNDHPPEFVTAENMKKYAVGWASEAVKQNDHLFSGKMVLADSKAIEDYKAGKKQLSCGYTADLIQENGTYDGEEYDYRQTNIRYNHVALVKAGRAGPQVRLLDSADEEVTGDIKEVPNMKKVKIDGKEFEVADEVAARLDSVEKSLKEKDAEMEDAKAKKAQAEKEVEDAKKMEKDSKGKCDTLQAKVDHLESQRADSSNIDEKIKAGVKARLHVEKVAGQVLGTEAKIDDKSDLDVMKEVILKKCPQAKLDGKNAAYVEARFDSIAEDSALLAERRDTVGRSLTPKVEDKREDKDFDPSAARARQIEESKKQHLEPLAAMKKKV